jgi:hypothetical protein
MSSTVDMLEQPWWQENRRMEEQKSLRDFFLADDCQTSEDRRSSPRYDDVINADPNHVQLWKWDILYHSLGAFCPGPSYSCTYLTGEPFLE